MIQLSVIEKHEQIITDLVSKLEKIDAHSDKILEQLEMSIVYCKQALSQMRETVIQDGFPDQECEIYFFKKLKPKVYSRLLYYLGVFEIQSKLPVANAPCIIKYYQKRMKGILRFMVEHQFEVQYYQFQFDHFDQKFFTHNISGIPLLKMNEYYLIDEKFHTWHDRTFSEIIANQLLIEYIQKEIIRLERPEISQQIPFKSKPRWTGDKIFLVELAYGMYYTGMINNGQTEIKTIVETLEQLFGVDLENYSRTFYDIKRRKIDRTKFLDIMKSRLENRMDEFDL